MKIVFGVIIFTILLIIGGIVATAIFSSTTGNSPLKSFGTGSKGEGGILFSRDRGLNWEWFSEIEEKGSTLARSDIFDIVFDPQDSNTMYAGAAGQGLLKSMNGGRTWRHLTDANGVLDSRATVFRILINPSNPKSMYLVSGGRVFKSENAGESFDEMYVVAKLKTTVWSIALDTYEPETIYIGTSDGLLLQSRDGGKFWQSLKQFSKGVQGIGSIIIQPSDTRVIYVTVPKLGVFKSIDKGVTWEDLTANIKSFSGVLNMTSLALDPGNPAVLYLTSDFGVLKSVDGGKHFEELKTIIPLRSLPVLSIAVDPIQNQTIYLSARNQFYISLDGGITWSVKDMSTPKGLSFIKINPRETSQLYIGTQKLGKK